jgi:integrase
MIKVHIRPKWAKMPILEVRPYAVRAWLRGLKCGPCRQGHIQDLMRVIFRNAMLWEWMPQGENPMKLFSIRGSSKRLKEPGTLTLEQIHALLEKLPGEPYRTMVVAAQGLGIRLSELMGLRWSDLNFAAGRIRIVRAIVEGHVGEVKTIHSAKELPLHSKLAEIFQAWQGLTEYKGSEHYVFASPFSDGEMPYSGGKIQSKILRPAGQELGLDFSLGWHTFRHTYRAMLRATGAPLDVQRDLMRHADIQTTAQVYGATKVDELRRINSMVIERLFNKEGGWPAQSNTR